jgi:beta-phosphoglucomutase-like phosphatase (HAD superfamily)
MSPPRALLLDLDGTLIDSEMVHAAGLVRLCRDRGVELTQDEALYVIGHGWREIYGHLRLGERIGLDLAAVIAGTVAAKEILFGEGLELPVLPGVRDLLALVRAAKIPTAIVTGSARCEFDQALPALGLRPADLAASVCAEDVPRGKPAPDGYLRAAQLLAVPAEACLVVEDSEAGIAAGIAAGMRVLAVAAGNRPVGAPGHQDQRGAHHRLASLVGLTLDDLARMMAPTESTTP